MAHGTAWIGLISLGLSLGCATKTVPAVESPPSAPAEIATPQREPPPAPAPAEPKSPEISTEGSDSRPPRGWREGPNLAILLTLDEKSAVIEQGKSFELWSGLGDDILKARMCARVEIFAVDQSIGARALRQRRAAAAERVLLLKGLPRELIVVVADADPSELMARGLDAESLRNGVLLTPLGECPR